jgi:hypothetical protein
MAKSNNENQNEHRKRKSHGGLFKRRDFWVHPDDEPELREQEKRFREKRLKELGF